MPAAVSPAGAGAAEVEGVLAQAVSDRAIAAVKISVRPFLDFFISYSPFFREFDLFCEEEIILIYCHIERMISIHYNYSFDA